MNKELDLLLADKVFEKIPADKNAIEYLMDKLDLSRKSVYRRRKGELSFTFEEISILSKELGFSVDELVAKSNENQAIFNLNTDSFFDPKETFILMLEKHLDFYRKSISAKSFYGAFTVNRILPIFALSSTKLFKFFYYMWMHQGYNVPLNFRYADMQFPSEILTLSQKAWEYARHVPSTTIIADKMVFKNIFMEFEYYYKRKLLTKEDFMTLADELLAYIKKTETVTSLGSNEYEAQYSIYLSKLNIASNSCYFRIDEDIESSFWVFGTSPIYTSNSTVFTSHKKWLDSLKKYSTLASQSNELLQSEFFNEQYKFVTESTERVLKE